MSNRGFVTDILKSVYLTLFLDALKSGKFLSLSRLKQQVRRLMGMHMPYRVDAHALCLVVYHIGVRFYVVARSTVMGLPEPQGVERATVQALTLFLFT